MVMGRSHPRAQGSLLVTYLAPPGHSHVPDPPGAVPQELQQNQHFCRQVSDRASPPVPAEGEGPHLGLSTKLASQQGQPSRHWGLGSLKSAKVLNWDFVFKIA